MPTSDPYQFERRVAALYRQLGSEVRHDVSLAGSQIDVVVTETTTSGSRIVRLVECKAYSKPVGIQQVRTFALTSGLLRDRRLADKAAIVAENGFSAQARDAAEEFDIELIELADLEAKVSSASTPTLPDSRRAASGPYRKNSGESTTESDTTAVERGDERIRAFVAIPFTPRYDDVYLLGILAAAEQVGISVERADDNLDSSEIIQYVKARICDCDLVIVDTTETNSNVFYELGFADGQNKNVILIAAANTQLPFDLQGRNHVLYSNIGTLRSKLAERLERLLNQSQEMSQSDADG